MSSLAFGVLTTERKEEDPNTKEPSSGLRTYLDIFAALVPAEVLAAHAFILTLATTSSTDDQGHQVVTITNEDGLKAAFWVLVVMAPFLYAVGRWFSGAARQGWDWRWDFVRLVIPGLAFVGWTMIQSNSAIDAVVDWSTENRTIAAVLAAPFVAAVAGVLSVTAKKEQPKPKAKGDLAAPAGT